TARRLHRLPVLAHQLRPKDSADTSEIGLPEPLDLHRIGPLPARPVVEPETPRRICCKVRHGASASAGSTATSSGIIVFGTRITSPPSMSSQPSAPRFSLIVRKSAFCIRSYILLMSSCSAGT